MFGIAGMLRPNPELLVADVHEIRQDRKQYNSGQRGRNDCHPSFACLRLVIRCYVVSRDVHREVVESGLGTEATIWSVTRSTGFGTQGYLDTLKSVRINKTKAEFELCSM
jgi:hypothetical protein